MVSVISGLWWACKFPNKTYFDLDVPPNPHRTSGCLCEPSTAAFEVKSSVYLCSVLQYEVEIDG